ncbi:MAG: T9SS type A sorting domain-containing protein [Bacteroidota bacterium]
MKKCILLILVVIALQLQAQTTITHSVSQIVNEGSPSCPIEPTSYLRVFDLENEFNITNNFEITEVEFGVWRSDVSGQITVNLYTTPTVDIVTGPLTLIYSGLETTVNEEISIHKLAPSVAVPSGSIIVFELQEVEDGIEFRIGANEEGQTGPSWIKSPICGFETVESAGFVSHFVVNVTGVESLIGIDDNMEQLTTIFPNPTNDIINIEVPTYVTLDTATLYDITGTDVGLELTGKQLDMSNLASGIYLLNVTTSEGRLVKKVIKQ